MEHKTELLHCIYVPFILISCLFNGVHIECIHRSVLEGKGSLEQAFFKHRSHCNCLGSKAVCSYISSNSHLHESTCRKYDHKYRYRRPKITSILSSQCPPPVILNLGGSFTSTTSKVNERAVDDLLGSPPSTAVTVKLYMF